MAEQDYNAVVELVINAPIERVWDGITKPEFVKQYMHGTNLETDWQVGSDILWRGDWDGKSYEDKGEVLVYDEPSKVSYTHWSPMGGTEDKPENYHTVTIELTEDGDSTKLVLTQANNPSQEAADKMADTAWKPMIKELKSVVEKS